MKILVPSNLTKSSQASADFAVSFFGANASYVMLNSFPFMYRSGFYDSFRRYAPESDEIPLDKLKREKKRLIQTFGERDIQLNALYGDPVKDIHRIAEEENIDLIVLGYSNFRRWKDGLTYRNKYSLMELQYPILLVPEDYTHHDTKCVYYVTDFTNSIESDSTKVIRTIAQLAQATITLYCFENNEEDNSIEKWMLDKYLVGLEHVFKIIPDLQTGLKNLAVELKKKENALVVFDFETDKNALFETVENYMKHQQHVKPLLLMPKRMEKNLLRGA